MLLDQWLTTGKKPADAVNTCTLPDGKQLTGGWDLYDDPGPCNDAYPIKGDPRTAAGEGIRLRWFGYAKLAILAITALGLAWSLHRNPNAALLHGIVVAFVGYALLVGKVGWLPRP